MGHWRFGSGGACGLGLDPHDESSNDGYPGEDSGRVFLGAACFGSAAVAGFDCGADIQPARIQDFCIWSCGKHKSEQESCDPSRGETES